MDTFVYIASILVANLIQGITGFAGNVIAMPGCAWAVGVDSARTALNVLSLVSGAVMAVWFHKHIVVRELGRILALIMPGIVIGIAVYDLMPANVLLLPYGVVVAAVGVWYLRGGRQRQRDRRVARGLPADPTGAGHKAAMALIVTASGVMQGMFVSGGPLLVIYAADKLHDKEDFRATVSAVWFVLNVLIFVQNLMAGHVDAVSIDWAWVGLVPMLAATFVGGRVQAYIKQAAFMRFTYVLLIACGVLISANEMAALL